ncbi:MAG: methylated-DNA--[protein]-cysteine S-methyltransferase [Cyclobacteriaceae bacterium]
MLHTHQFSTPIGDMHVGATDAGVCLLEFSDRQTLETQFEDLRRMLKAKIVEGKNEHTRKAVTQVCEYFEGNRMAFDLELLMLGTEFQNRVWKELQNIPFGTTRAYGEQAMALGDKKAIRAVASANGKNRMAIVIPCHRVIGATGELTGYAGGLHRKRWLLNHESSQLSLGI